MTEKKIDGVSEATRRNWRRLGVSLETKRLDRRANKQFSRRRFLPVEYLRCPDLKSAIETLSDFFDHCITLST